MSDFSERISSLLFEFLPVGIAGYAAYKVLLGKKFFVEHGDRERLVIKNIITGELSVIGQGAHYMPLWYELDTRVDLNKEPVQSEAHEAKSSDGIDLVAQVRYNVLTGRDFDEVNGQLVSGPDTIDDEKVKLAVTATDFKNRQKYVKDVVSAVIDAILREFRAEELLVVLDSSGYRVKIPKHMSAKHLAYKLKQHEATDGHQLFEYLAAYIQREVNYNLRNVGFNIDELAIQDLRPTNKELQTSFDAMQAVRNKLRAVHQLDNDAEASGLSPAEKFALNTDHQGQATMAAAIRYAADKFLEIMNRYKQP